MYLLVEQVLGAGLYRRLPARKQLDLGVPRRRSNRRATKFGNLLESPDIIVIVY